MKLMIVAPLTTGEQAYFSIMHIQAVEHVSSSQCTVYTESKTWNVRLPASSFVRLIEEAK